MPRGGYDCTGAAPGSFASREGRQMFSAGGSTPRASAAAVFPGMQQQQAGQYHPAAGSTTPRASQMFLAPHATVQTQTMGANGMMAYGFQGAVPQTGYMQQGGGYMAGPSFAPQPQMQAYNSYAFAPSAIQTNTMQAGNANLMYGGAGSAAPFQQQQPYQPGGGAQYGVGYPGQAPYYRPQ